MKLRVLGCSGGVGAQLRTTSLLIDDDVLIDCGSGVGDLTLDEMVRIRHVFLTHSHLDHVAFLPLMLDSVFQDIQEPLVIHGQAATLEALQQHIFNWAIWPDFTQLPTRERPVTRFALMHPGEVRQVGARNFEMIAVHHTVPAVGYRVEASSGGVFAFSGDTTTNDSFWQALNARERLDLLVVETAFANADAELSRLARHYCPSLLGEDIRKLRHRPRVLITHNKPGEEASIFTECEAAMPGWDLVQLKGGDVFQV